MCGLLWNNVAKEGEFCGDWFCPQAHNPSCPNPPQNYPISCANMVAVYADLWNKKYSIDIIQIDHKLLYLSELPTQYQNADVNARSALKTLNISDKEDIRIKK